MVPDPAEVLDVIEEATLLSSLKLSVSTNLTCFCIVLQIKPRIFEEIRSLANYDPRCCTCTASSANL